MVRCPTGLALGAGSVWVPSIFGEVCRIDPSASKVVETFNVTRRLQGRHRWEEVSVVFAEGSLWLAGLPKPVVIQLEPAVRSLLRQFLNAALGQSVALFAIGAVYDMWGLAAARRWLPVGIGTGLLFLGITAHSQRGFLLFILYESAAMVLSLSVYAALAFQQSSPGARWMVAGVLLTISAAALQANPAVAFTCVWRFDHNGVFHLVQILALYCLHLGLRRGMIRSSPDVVVTSSSQSKSISNRGASLKLRS